MQLFNNWLDKKETKLCAAIVTPQSRMQNKRSFAEEEAKRNAVKKGCLERLLRQRRWFVSFRPRLVREINLRAVSKCLQVDKRIKLLQYACKTCLLRFSNFTCTYPHGFQGVDKVSLFRGCTQSSPFSRSARRCTHCSATYTLDQRQVIFLRCSDRAESAHPPRSTCASLS